MPRVDNDRVFEEKSCPKTVPKRDIWRQPVGMEQTEKHRRLGKDEKFRFLCHNRLSCFNTCCNDINIFLTPYDVLRMRKATQLSSGDFLKRYTVALLGNEGLPLVLLKMLEDENKNCPFVADDGCSIYRHRPWSCRMYPIFPVSSECEGFMIEKNSFCLGFNEGKQWTVDEWRVAQEIDVYDEMNEPYKEITFNDFFEKGNKLEPAKAKTIYSSCYDLDQFRRFVFQTRFLDIYDVEEDVIEKMKENEEELLLFSYRWIRFNLFGEDTLRPKDEKLNELLQSRKSDPEQII
jgi:Fe-S-cluster containining protein